MGQKHQKLIQGYEVIRKPINQCYTNRTQDISSSLQIEKTVVLGLKITATYGGKSWVLKI